MTHQPISRRDFLQLGTKLAIMMGLSRVHAPALAEALGKLAGGTAPVLWLQGLSCSGCSVALLNGEAVNPGRLITQYISLGFHPTLSAATGHVAVDAVNRMISTGDYLLAVEGAVPVAMPRACVFGEEYFTDQLIRAARRARAIVAVGSCSTNGGVPAAEGNPTGALSVPAFLARQAIKTPVVSIPGCPAHPDWVIGTLAHLLKIGLPALDDASRPKAYFGRLLHDQCPRFSDYERENFAEKYGELGCLFRLGCLGPITHADCTVRGWNGGTNDCIRAGAPCIGCASAGFSCRADFPLSRQQEARERS